MPEIVFPATISAIRRFSDSTNAALARSSKVFVDEPLERSEPLGPMFADTASVRCSNGNKPMTFRLAYGAIKTMGRAPRADFVVDAALVSRVHCRVTAGRDGLEVEDLKSTNGTFVNDRRVERGRLGDGDRLRIGRIELTVQKK